MSLQSYTSRQETNLYYLSTRYYNPELGRFLNADEFTTTGQLFVGNNMFAYCLNNPVNISDINGKLGFGIMLGKTPLGAAVNVLTTYIGARVTGQSYSWKDAGVAALAGALGTGGTGLKIAAATYRASIDTSTSSFGTQQSYTPNISRHNRAKRYTERKLLY